VSNKSISGAGSSVMVVFFNEQRNEHQYK